MCTCAHTAHTYETVKTDMFLLLLGNYEFCIIQEESNSDTQLSAEKSAPAASPVYFFVETYSRSPFEWLAEEWFRAGSSPATYMLCPVG